MRFLSALTAVLASIGIMVAPNAAAEPSGTGSNGWVTCYNTETDIYPVTERVRASDAVLVGYTWYCVH